LGGGKENQTGGNPIIGSMGARSFLTQFTQRHVAKGTCTKSQRPHNVSNAQKSGDGLTRTWKRGVAVERKKKQVQNRASTAQTRVAQGMEGLLLQRTHEPKAGSRNIGVDQVSRKEHRLEGKGPLKNKWVSRYLLTRSRYREIERKKKCGKTEQKNEMSLSE